MFLLIQKLSMMNIAINGATGFIGSNLSHYLSCIGHSVIPIGRAIYYDQHKLKQTLEGTNVVINLAGASINHRWSKSYQHEIYSSRVDVTRQLVKAINSLSHKPELLISASAVGFYDSQGIHNEYNHRQGKGFLPALCRDWEAEANQVSSDIRLSSPGLASYFPLMEAHFRKWYGQPLGNIFSDR